MANQQLKAHCEDAIANAQEHSEMELAMAKVLLPCLNAKPKAWFTDDAENDRSATTYDPEMADRWRNKPWFVGELFTAPPAPELKPIELLDCDYGAVSHMSGGSDDYCKGFVDGAQYAAHTAREAGYEVKV